MTHPRARQAGNATKAEAISDAWQHGELRAWRVWMRPLIRVLEQQADAQRYERAAQPIVNAQCTRHITGARIPEQQRGRTAGFVAHPLTVELLRREIEAAHDVHVVFTADRQDANAELARLFQAELMVVVEAA